MHNLVTSLLFVEARQLFPDILVRGVEGSVDFLQVEEKRGEKKNIAD